MRSRCSSSELGRGEAGRRRAPSNATTEKGTRALLSTFRVKREPTRLRRYRPTRLERNAKMHVGENPRGYATRTRTLVCGRRRKMTPSLRARLCRDTTQQQWMKGARRFVRGLRRSTSPAVRICPRSQAAHHTKAKRNEKDSWTKEERSA
jgi:hypothetical protein